MSPLKKSNNLAARMGRWSANHWKTAVFGWLAFVVASLFIGNVVGTKQIDNSDANVGQAQKADQILKRAGFADQNVQAEFVLVQSKTLSADAPAFRAVVNDVVRTVGSHSTIEKLQSPYDAGRTDQISKDRHTVQVSWQMKGDEKVAQKSVDALTAGTAAVAERHPGFFVGEAGAASSGKALDKMFNDQLKQAGERSIPITIAVLLLVFGALVAAGIPLLLALSAVAATIGLVAIPSHLIPMDQNVSAVLLLIGLAVGVDYSLFYLKREREERKAGRSAEAALEAAAATSGRSVLISGFTVMIAMAGMLFSGQKSYLSFGVATMMVVGIAMLGSLTVLPALLSKLGDRVERGRIPFLQRRRREGGRNIWKAVLTPALRHPLIAAVASGAVLLAMAFPVLHLHTSTSGLETLPKSIPTVPTILKLQDAFPGGVDPATVAIKADTTSRATQQAIAKLRSQALASGEMTGPINVDVNPSKTVARVRIPLKGNG